MGQALIPYPYTTPWGRERLNYIDFSDQRRLRVIFYKWMKLPGTNR